MRLPRLSGTLGIVLLVGFVLFLVLGVVAVLICLILRAAFPRLSVKRLDLV